MAASLIDRASFLQKTLAPKMLKHFFIVFLSLYMVYCSSALADDNTDKQIIESALRETRDITEDKAILFMRYIRRHLKTIEEAKAEQERRSTE
jgi:hypothetical protein